MEKQVHERAKLHRSECNQVSPSFSRLVPHPIAHIHSHLHQNHACRLCGDATVLFAVERAENERTNARFHSPGAWHCPLAHERGMTMQLTMQLGRKRWPLRPGSRRGTAFSERRGSCAPRDMYMYKSQVAKHKEKDDAWCVIEGKVYNITNFLLHHPGFYLAGQVSSKHFTNFPPHQLPSSLSN